MPAPAPAAGPPPEVPPAPDTAKNPTTGIAPDSLGRTTSVGSTGGVRRYCQDDKRQSLALRASDSTISSKDEDLVPIRAMLALAEACG